MDSFHERLLVRAATVDEVLSGGFEEASPGQNGDADLAARRLAAWCRAAASGDGSLFDRRLARDGLTAGQVLARFANARRKAHHPAPAWFVDASWIEPALQNPGEEPHAAADQAEPCAFEQLLWAVVGAAETRLWQGIDRRAAENLSAPARAGLRRALLETLSGLCAPALYERFGKIRKAAPSSGPGHGLYRKFIVDMQAGGWRRLFEDRPVLLRLMATLTRQWIEVTREFVLRLDADLAAIRRDLLPSAAGAVARIDGDVSDAHNGGRSVRIVTFIDGARVVYKPKDLRLDVAWHDLLARLNREAPLKLKAVRVIARDGYGWSEFIGHGGTDAEGCKRFFRRAGAWLALLHAFAAADMHQENMIASGDDPVPIDLETIFHTGPAEGAVAPEEQAAEAAREMLANSVMAVGLLPAYGRSPFNNVFAVGGLTSGWTGKTVIAWTNVNTDEMRPIKAKHGGADNPNLPHVDGATASFADHIEDFVAGFADYAKFLSRITRSADLGGLFEGFTGLPVRKVIRPTRFYSMLLQRLKNQQSMDDGVAWSAQADFLARLSDWDRDADPMWPLQRAERASLLTLNVPHFTSPSDGDEIGDAEGTVIHTGASSGLARARSRVRDLDDKEIAWQVEVIRANTVGAKPPPRRPLVAEATAAPDKNSFKAEADNIAAEISRDAIRRGASAAWIGLDWLGDADVAQLSPLGVDFYNGTSGIALFLAAHARVTGATASADLARAGVAYLRKQIKDRNAARFARSLGLGGGTGIGGIVYALTVMAQCLDDGRLRADAEAAAGLITDALIAADKQLDVIGGAAGAILGLLRLYRDTGAASVLARAEKCGEHLLAQSRLGPQGRRSWAGLGVGTAALNGMSHGAAGFAYALSSLAKAAGRDDFAGAAAECIAYENASYDATRHNWPDLRAAGAPAWPCQWCHGAPGIGLARIGTGKRGAIAIKSDIEHAVAAVERAWPNNVDTLCCGTLGSVEFLCEAGEALHRDDLRDLAARRLFSVLQSASTAGDYRWNSGRRQFNLGLFRGLAGVGYTALRQVDASLPNVLIWD